MERIIKIGSDNAFSEQALPGFFTNSKLLDLTIPGNATYDLSKSYINLNMGVVPSAALGGNVAGITSADTALYSTVINMQQNVAAGANNSVASCATLVRNAQMQSQNRGMVESIRRVDTLRTLLYYLENDKKEVEDGLDKFGSFQGRRGVGNRTGDMIQTVVVNTGVDGVADLNWTSNAITRDWRINFSDLFGVGNAMWNGRVFGETRINLELNINRLRLSAASLGLEANTAVPAGMGTGTYGSCADQAAVGQGTGIFTLATTGTYKDPQLNFPFHVGQAIEITGVGSAEGGAILNADGSPLRVVIAAIEYQGNNSANPPTPVTNEVMLITTRTAWYTTPGAQGNTNLTQLAIKGLSPNLLLSSIVINRAELVLTEMVGVDGPEEIDYRTYTTDEQNGNQAVNYFHQYAVEPNAQNLIVAHCEANEILPAKAWDEYRIAINNVDQTGNRSVFYRKNLHQDRMLRFMNNRGQPISNITMSALDCDDLQAAGANQTDLTPICETLPLTAGMKTVTLQIAAIRNISDVLVYKELVRTI